MAVFFAPAEVLAKAASRAIGALSLHLKIMGLILAIKFAARFNWTNLWVESDSEFVVDLFKSLGGVRLRNRWLSALASSS